MFNQILIHQSYQPNSKTMRKQFLLSILVAFVLPVFGQLTGVKTIPGNYASIEAAIADLNTQGVGAGGVTFNVAAGHTETFSSLTAGTITTQTGTSTSPIVFQKSGAGLNPKITAPLTGTGTQDGIIKIAGCDYVTFDGIDLQENAGNTTSTTQMEWGYAILKASETNGSQFITIKNCVISLTSTNTSCYGIYSNNHTTANTTQLVVSSVAGTNSNNKFFGNTFTGIYNGIYLYGRADAAPYTFYDQNNEIGVGGANTFTAFGGGTATSYGIYSLYQNNLKIANNNFTGTHNNTTGAAYCIYMTTMVNASMDVYNNTVSMIHNSTGAFYGFYSLAAASGTNNVTNYYNNSVINCTAPNIGSGAWYGIYVYGGQTASFYNNVVSNCTIGSATATATGSIYGIYKYCSPTTAGTLNMYNNSVTNITRTQSTPGTGFGYYFYISGGNGVANVYNNLVNNLTIAASSTQYIGYHLYSGTKNFYDNTFTNVHNAMGTVYGLYNGNGVDGYFYRNKFANINSNAAASLVYGIYQNSGTSMYYYNNFVSELKAPLATNANAVAGIFINGGTNVGCYFNTVYLDAASTAGTFGTSGVYASTTPNVDLRNNIVVNASTPGATGLTVAYRRSSTTLTSYSNLSNNNDFFAGVPGASRLIYFDGTNSDQTLAAYKARVSPRDASSVTELPPFVNVAASPYNLHIQTTIANQMESGGATVSAPFAITDDIDGNPRFPNPGFPNNPGSPASAPDIGADEFAGIMLDLTPPNISFAPLGNTSSTAPRLLTTSITDATGVPTAGAGLPVLYWRVNAGPYAAATATWVSGSTYTFSFGGGVSLNDVISYYIVAQDLAIPVNVGANPSGGASGYSANPPAASTPPTTPYSYTIVGTLSGTYPVGTGQVYPTLTAAVADLNLKEVIGNVVFELWDANYSAAESFPLIIYPFATNNSLHTVTFRPRTGVTPVITGSPATGILVLFGCDNIILDGSNSGGTDKSMTWENTNTASNAYVLGIFNNSGDPASNCTLKNCIIRGSSQITNNTYGIIFNALGGGYDNIEISNNTILSARYGMQVAGVAGTPATNNKIINNVIGSVVDAQAIQYRGIVLSYAHNTLIEGNEIMGAHAGNTNYSQAGLYIMAGSTSSKIRKNKIHDWYYTGTGGWGQYGIYYSAEATSVTEIYNNLIYNIRADGYSASVSSLNPHGIFINAGGNLQIYHNTIFMGGNYLSSSYNPWVGCITATSSASLLDIRNNILKNSMQPVSGTPTSKTFGIINGGGAAVFSNINYNDYFSDGIGPNIGYQGGDFATLAAWQGATGQDANSKNIDPQFVSATNLSPTNVTLDNLGMYMPAIPQDINGVTRTNPPDMGAIEFGVTPVVVTTAAGPIAATTATLNGTINASGLVVNSFFDYGLTTAYGSTVAGTPASVTGSTTTAVLANISGLASLTTYHYRLRGVTAGGVTVYGQNMTFTTTGPPPTVVTTAATGITTTGATLNGTVNANGSSTTVTFEYGLTTAYGSTVTAIQSPVGGNTVTPVSAPITGLTPNTVYNYRVKGVSGAGTSNGNNMTFTTAAAAPTAVTNAATNVTTNSATLNGTVNANNANTTVTFEWGLTTAYGNTVNATPLTVTGTSPVAVLANISGLITNTTYNYRVKAVNAGGTTFGSNMTFLTGCPMPGAAGPITGPTNLCQSTTGHVYSVGSIANATSYVWTLPVGATITAGANTNSITVSYGAAAVSGNVSVYGTSACGNGAPSSLAVTVNPRPVPTLTGPNSVCAGTTGNVYTTQTGMSNYVWTVSAGGSITAGGTSTSNSVTVTWNTAGTGTVTVSYTSPAGCAATTPASYAVTVNARPVPTITGPTSMCQGATGQVYATQAGMTNYVWTVSAGGTITAGAGTNSITVTWAGSGAQTVSVNYTNASGCSATNPGQLNVTVNPTPAPSINGPANPCISPDVHTYYTESGMSNYVWTVSAGGSIYSGQGTAVLKVIWNTTGMQTISLTYTSQFGCNMTTPYVKNIMVNPVPNPAGTITGITSVCAGQNLVTYSTTSILNASSYEWTVPQGATIASGNGTLSIAVNYGASAVSGNITVAGVNNCGPGTPSVLAVTVNPLPSAAGNITGLASVCQGAANVSYTVPVIQGATGYTWSLPPGATITNGANTNSIKVTFSNNASSGNITVYGTNACGNGTVSPNFAVTVNPIPSTPVITLTDYTLTSSAPDGNQWYFNGVLIPGATGQTHVADQSGNYHTVVTLNGCSSLPSNMIEVIITGIHTLSSGSFRVYPIPSDGRFTAEIISADNQTYTLAVYSTIGVRLYEETNLSVYGKVIRSIDLSHLPGGVYTIILYNADHQAVRRVVINK